MTQRTEKEPLNSAVNAQAPNPKDSYEGRKHEPEIDGPDQDSQETDEIYADPRHHVILFVIDKRRIRDVERLFQVGLTFF